MKTKDTTSKLTRRSAFGLIPAGLTLPATRALAAKEKFTRIGPQVYPWPLRFDVPGEWTVSR